MPSRSRKKPEVSRKWLCPYSEYCSIDKEEKERLKGTMPYTFSKDWAREAKFGALLLDLKRYGCAPAILLRDKKWRFYINSGTNMYDESSDLRSAFKKAFKKWVKSRMPTHDDRYISLYVRELKQNGSEQRILQWRIR